jgi:hypothetical protein
MLNKTYNINISENTNQYEFFSVGKNGEILKVVTLSEANIKGFYDLAMTDYDPSRNYFDDLSVSNNGDTSVILATVAYCIVDFLNRNTEAAILATGSTHSRNRLYRIAISTNIDNIKSGYKIYGLKDKKWEIFQKNVDYIGFLIKKINN